jgi:hypothetical protein
LRTTCPHARTGGGDHAEFQQFAASPHAAKADCIFLIALLKIFAATKPAARKMAEPSQSLTMY